MTKLISPRLNRRLRPAGLMALIISAALVAFAQGRPAVKVQLNGAVDRAGKEVALADAKAVGPGEVLRWTVLSLNEGQAPALNYQTTAPVPKGTAYVPGSASGELSPQITFSIDGGRAYSAQPMIPERQPDGSTKMVPAPASSYTHVRFQWAASLAASNSVKAYYSTRVK